jgi:riboflavin synthase
MFTGIVEETGSLIDREPRGDGLRLWIDAPRIGTVVQSGQSVAVNGVCLTATEIAGSRIAFDVLHETLSRTNLGEIPPGGLLNLEQALRVDSRWGGHFVQGHVDCTAAILEFTSAGADYRLTIELPPEFAPYVVMKGPIAIDGISLTVAGLDSKSLSVWIIPHTRAVTNLMTRQIDDRLNVEFDLLAKYVERLALHRATPTELQP